ncbi:right-handed parallel beta-helix repeat-containing protein [Bacillus circulans]|nr:right-handed parallel beta-helix repeat-containing protein [Niallia circulans]
MITARVPLIKNKLDEGIINLKKEVVILIAIVILVVIIYGFIDWRGKTEDRETEPKINQEQETGIQSLYVSPTGNDRNDGSKEHPFQTLKKAADKAVAGTTVYIREGIYKEPLTVKHSGKKELPIVFQAYDQEKVIISGVEMAEKEEETSLITIQNKNYVSIKGLIMEDLSTSLADETVMGIYIAGSSSHIVIENNVVRKISTLNEDGNAHGIAVYGTEGMKNIVIRNNVVQDLKLGASEALVLNGNIDGFIIEGNTVRNNDNIGIDLIGYEGTGKKDDFTRNGIIKNNIVYNNSSFGNPAYGEDYSAAGIYVDGGKNIKVKANTVYLNDLGIEATSEHRMKYADNIEITHNIVYENVYTGISIGGYDEERGGTTNTIIAKNILYQNDTKGLEGGQLLLQYDTKKNTIQQNIMTTSSSQLFIVNEFQKNVDNRLVKNIYHKEENKQGRWIWKGEEYTDFIDFKEASNSDKQSMYIDPKYKNPLKHDFDLKPNSPVYDILSE